MSQYWAKKSAVCNCRLRWFWQGYSQFVCFVPGRRLRGGHIVLSVSDVTACLTGSDQKTHPNSPSYKQLMAAQIRSTWVLWVLTPGCPTMEPYLTELACELVLIYTLLLMLQTNSVKLSNESSTVKRSIVCFWIVVEGQKKSMNVLSATDFIVFN